MYATEFQTVINEPYIKVPNYETFKGHEVRVVFLDLNINKNIEEQNNNLDFFDKYQLDLSNFKLDRDKANER
jgi:hypothetical protein